MAGGVEDDLDLVLAAAEFLGVAEGDGRCRRLAHAVDLVVREERVVGDVVLLLLAHHDVGGIVEHALDQHPARRRHDDGRVRVLPHRDRQAADVVQVAVGDDDQVELLAPQRRQVGRRARGPPSSGAGRSRPGC